MMRSNSFTSPIMSAPIIIEMIMCNNIKIPHHQDGFHITISGGGVRSRTLLGCAVCIFGDSTGIRTPIKRLRVFRTNPYTTEPLTATVIAPIS